MVLEAKRFLRSNSIPRLAGSAGNFPYIALEAIRSDLASHGLNIEPATLNHYMHDLMKEGVLFDAGRGWYSTVAEPFIHDREPVRGFVAELGRWFPLLDFCVWSTAQVAGYGHHQLARFTHFVHTDRVAMESVADALRRAGRVAFLDPEKREVGRNVHLSHGAIVVRPAVTRAPVEGKYATIEKILVDLYFEADDLGLIDRAEWRKIFHNAVSRRRISVGTMVSYARRRKIPEGTLIGRQSIKSTF